MALFKSNEWPVFCFQRVAEQSMMGVLCGGRKAGGRVAARGESTPAFVNYSPWMLLRVVPLPPAVSLSFVPFSH